MTDFTDGVRRAFELYLFGKKKEALAHLMPGSKYHTYLSILDAMKNEKSKLSKDTKEMIVKFTENHYEAEQERIYYRKLFLDYDAAKNDAERKQALDNIANQVGAYYHHTKPMDMARKTHKKELKKDKPAASDIAANLFDPKKTIDQIHNEASNYLINTLHRSFYDEVDFSKISDDAFLSFISSAGNLADITTSSFTEKYASALTEQYKNNTYYNIEYHIVDKLTIEQMEDIEKKCQRLKSDENWIGKLFEKKFHKELSEEVKESTSLEDRREQLIRMYDGSKNRPQSLRSSLLLEILDNGMKLDVYDKKYFLEYLKSPLKTWYLNTDNAKYENYSYIWEGYMRNIQNRSGGQINSSLDEKLFRTYLEQFYRDKGDIKEFENFFETNFIRKLIEEFEFYDGKEINANSINASIFEDLRDKVVIELTDCNKELFKKEDRVQIVAELKNVPQLYVKLYEFDRKTELSGCSDDYYQKNLTPFSTDLNFDGLITKYEKVFEFDEPPQKKFRKVFDFPELDNRVGLFILEFIGSGYSARAVIKKGSLSLIAKPTVAGHMAYVLDENHEICKGDNAGLWFQGKFYKADPEKNGKIVIPYEKSPATDKAILVNNGFAQLAEFNRMTEFYALDVGYFVQRESLLMGNEAKILVRPVLKVNDRVCTLKALKNTIIKVTTVSFIDQIPVTKIFEDPPLSDNNEIVLNFQVPPNLESVSISFETKVRNISNQRLDTLTSSHYISMKTNSYNMIYYEDYLRLFKGNFYYYVLGKNGEPIEDLNININFSHNLMPNSSSSTRLTTDEEGKVNLGPCANITKLAFNFEGSFGYSSSEYSLPKTTNSYCYPSTMNVLEDEDIEIPFPNSNFNQGTFSLLRVSCPNGKIIENLFTKASYENDKEFDSGSVVIRGLEAGYYQLEFKELDIKIDIGIHSGVYWETDSFILKQHSLVEKRDRTNFIRISKPVLGRVEDEKVDADSTPKKEETKDADNIDQKYKLKFKVKGYRANCRVHVYGVSFLPSNLLTHFQNNISITSRSVTLDIFRFAKWTNAFISNRQLGDEYRYVFERKLKERFIGNTLDRPQLLLKRNKIRATQFDQEQLTAGTNYGRQEVEGYGGMEVQMQQPMPMSSSLHRNIAPMMQKQQFMTSSTSNVAPMQNSYYGGGIGYESYTLDQYPSFLNFLKTSAFIADNLHPDNDGNIEVEFEAQKYSTLLILALDDDTCTHTFCDVGVAQDEMLKRDLSLNEPLANDKYYNEVRNSENITKDNKIVIDDITSTEYMIIDSLDKVKRVQDEIRKINGQQPVSQDLLFLLKWDKLVDEEKNKKYNNFMCHDVNLFIYFKDRDYFNRVVKPFLANKMEKTFVDHYLLGEYDRVLEYSDINNFNQLNPFEQCLLIDVVVKSDKELAKKMAERLAINAETNKFEDDRMSKLFDTVLNLNMLTGNDKVNLDDLADESDASSAHNFDQDGGPPMQNFPYNINQNFGMAFGAAQNTGFGGGGLFGAQNTGFGGGGGLFGANTSQNYAAPMFQQQQNNLFGAQNQMQSLFSNFNRMDHIHDRGEMMYQNQNLNLDFHQNAYNNPFGNDYEQLEVRRTQASQFQALEEACEYAETNYYKNNNLTSTHIFPQYKFWSDLAVHITETGSISGFLNSSFMFAFSKCTEMICSWAVLDLDYQSKKHTMRATGNKGISIKASGNMIVFKKEIKESEADLDNNLLVIHRFFENGAQNSDIRKLKEYLTHQVYGCEIIITNVSSSTQNFSILYQIPEGSLPLNNTNYQKSESKSLTAYSTIRMEFYFYFPRAGHFTQFPSNITINDKVVAVANQCDFKVSLERQEESFETFRDIVISGDQARILEFLKTKNLMTREMGFDYNDIYWMYDNKKFWTQVVEVLRERRIYDDTTWKYSFKHYDFDTIKEAIRATQHVMQKTGTFFEASLIKCTPKTSDFRHLDYFPLINARAHTVGKNINAGLLNVQFRATYYKFLKAMAEKEQLETEDWLSLSYYFLLQDRIKEAIDIIIGDSHDSNNLTAKIKPDDIKEGSSLKLQYDYMRAYLDFFIGFKEARTIAKKYEDYPVISWRILFTEILDQLNEYEGIEDLNQEIDQEDEEKKKQNLKNSKKLEPYLECELEGKKISIDHANIPKLKVKYYLIDLEVLFSRTPFLIKSTEDLANAKPILVEEYDLSDPENKSSNTRTIKIDVADEYHDKNVMIELHGLSKQRFLTYFSNSMKVHITEDFGEIKVTTKDDQVLPKVYIKAIAQYEGGETKFFKDGYTDIRGKFEYAQINSSKMSGIKKFAILVMSDDHGALTKEARPPRNIEQSVVKKDADLGFLKPQQYARFQHRALKK